MARAIEDIAALMSVCGGPDARDPWSHGAVRRDYGADARPRGDMTGVRIAWAPTIGNAALEHETRQICEQAVDAFRALGAEIAPVEIDLSEAVDILLAIVGALASAAYADKLPEFGDRIDKSLRIGIELGGELGADDLEKALFGRAELFRKIEAVLAEHDLLITPTLTRPAIAADHFAFDPIEIDGELYRNPRFDWYPYTHPFNHTGHPALAVPAGLDGGQHAGRAADRRRLARRGPADPRRRRARGGAALGGPPPAPAGGALTRRPLRLTRPVPRRAASQGRRRHFESGG